MDSETEIIALVAAELVKLQPPKQWMTVRGLKTRLGEALQGVDSGQLEELLIAHANTPGRQLRYSWYPSKSTLDLLWGCVDVVGERARLPGVDYDGAREHEACPVTEKAPWCFISHNHRDVATVIGLRNALVTRGYGAWVSAAEIGEQERINQEVQQGIADAAYFLLYFTRRSAGSLWVRKEWESVCLAGDKRPFVVIDGTDDDLLRLLMTWHGYWTDHNAIKDFAQLSAASVGQSVDSRWTGRCAEFVQDLRDFLGHEPRLIPYPPLSGQTDWSSAYLRLVELEAVFPDLH